MEAGANPNKQQKNGKTPLHYAAEYGHVEVIGYMLQNRGDLFARTEKGQTALELAKSHNQTEVAEILDKIMQHFAYRIS